MRVLYVRISSAHQKTDRQRVNEGDFDLTIEDTCSGAIPFFERVGGIEIKKLIDKKVITSLHVLEISRLGRNLRDILNSIHFFSEKGISIHFISQSLNTLKEDGTSNPLSTMMISILGVVAEMEREQIRERQLEGIKIAKLKGLYKGRKNGTKEDTLTFLSKPKNKKALELLKKGYKGVEVAKLAGVHPNTVTKIKAHL